MRCAVPSVPGFGASRPAEVVTIAGTTIATVLAGMGFFLRTWMSQNKETLAQAEKRVEAAEKREAEAKADKDTQNKRIDQLTDGVTTQTRTITDLAAALKVMGDAVKAQGNWEREDMKKVNDGITTLLARGDRHTSRT